MKAIRKLILIITIIILGTLLSFFFGWTQFSIPAGKYGVLLSKSGGYYQQVITPGAFTWRWELLIPTNGRVLIFDLSPRKVSYAVTGSLPSADQYAKILNSKETFTWSFSAEALVTLKPEQLVPLVAKNTIQTQEALETHIDASIQSALQSLMQHYITDLLDDPYEYQKVKTDYSAFTEKVKNDLQKKVNGQFSVEAVTLSAISIPDLNTYKIAEQAYAVYEQNREMLLAETAAQEAQRAASEQFQIERLTKWGDFLAKYPKILELIAVAQKDSKSALDALKAVQHSDKD
ncbi:MAG: SPFH domain-containing protein [Treponema sp.]